MPDTTDTAPEGPDDGSERRTGEEYHRFLEYTAKIVSPRLHRAHPGELQEAARLTAKYGVYNLDFIALGPPNAFGQPSKLHPVLNTDFQIVQGTRPLLCPRAEPKIPAELLPALTRRARPLLKAKPGETVLYVGRQAKPETLCMYGRGCDCFGAEPDKGGEERKAPTLPTPSDPFPGVLVSPAFAEAARRGWPEPLTPAEFREWLVSKIRVLRTVAAGDRVFHGDDRAPGYAAETVQQAGMHALRLGSTDLFKRLGAPEAVSQNEAIALLTECIEWAESFGSERPSHGYLVRVIEAVEALLRAAETAFWIEDQTEPPGIGGRFEFVVEALMNLERVFNPRFLPFGDPQRNTTTVFGYRDAEALAIKQGLIQLKDAHDWILGEWKFEGLAEGKFSYNGPSPPKIPRETWNGMRAALQQLTAVGLAPSPPPIAAASDACQDPDTTDGGDRLPPDAAESSAVRLTAVERAMQIYLRDPNQSVRKVAELAGCDPSLLYRDERFKRLREAHRGKLTKGSKSKDGALEGEEE